MKRYIRSSNADSSFAPQKFKLVHSAYGNKTYESDLFEIKSYSHDTPHTSWKESGYDLQFKKRPSTRERFDTLREAKAWLETEEAQDWYRKHSRKAVQSATEVTRWTDYLSDAVLNRLKACRTIKDDLPELVNAKWRFMKQQGKDKEGFVREDALVAVLELLDANSCDNVADLTVDEYNDLKQ